jgi:hypothetical protein
VFAAADPRPEDVPDAPAQAASRPLVEQYLHSGQLARGEQVLEAALAATPDDDQLRFGLAVLQLVRGVERLGQALFEYGCRSENTNAPFLRLPVPTNPDPSEISDAAFRRVLDGFRSDLETVEATLASVKDRNVVLPLRLADIRLDLTGKGDADERFGEILKKLMGPGFRMNAENPEFLVRFDRGDVAWLRAYCHLLMAIIDVQLAIDTEPAFRHWSGQQFARLKHQSKSKDEKEQDAWNVVRIKEPARLGHFRKHILKVCELNRETWAFIRAETDNDQEWLPNPRQTGVLRMPVTDVMIDTWLSMMAELEDLFDSKKVFPAWLMNIFHQKTTKGFNIRAFLDDPPDQIDWDKVRQRGYRDKYLDGKLPDLDVNAFVRVFEVFRNPLAVGYAAWFN